MKAIQIKATGSAENLEYVEIPTPAPGDNQVLVKTRTIGVTFGDIMMQHGTYPLMPPLPAVLGSECSGTVESVGKNVANLKPGQRVVVTGSVGCYAEYVVAESNRVMPIPDGIEDDLIAVFPIAYLTAYHLLHTTGHIKAGQTILLYGAAGGVGTAVIQLARMANVTVIGLSSSNDKIAYAKQQGADHVINYKTEDVEARIKKITGNKGVDLILNSVAGDTFERDVNMLANMGQIVWFGFSAGFPQANLTALLGSAFMKGVAIRTFTLYNILDSPQLLTPSFETLIQHLVDGKIRPHIEARIPLSDAAKAHRLMEESKTKGRILLIP